LSGRVGKWVRLGLPLPDWFVSVNDPDEIEDDDQTDRNAEQPKK
jgi:hypothetical protein